MTIEQVGSIGEIIGALATLATLVYLAVQIRGNTRMMRSQTRHVAHQLNEGPSTLIAQNPQMAGVFRRGTADINALDPDEQTQFVFLIALYFTNFHNSYGEVELGIESEADLESHWIGPSLVFQSSGARAVWEMISVSYPEDFQAYVQSKLSASK